MKRALSIGLLLGCGTLYGCAASILGGSSQSRPAANARTAHRVSADAGIAADVKSRLIAEPALRSLPINVDAYDSIVSLKGNVRTGAQRSTAGSLAGKVRGVKSVRNELVVN